jgi:hypothetical protein
MSNVLAFSSGPDDWKHLLADPKKHWRMGFSARTLAHSWEDADGFPAEVDVALSASEDPLLAGLTPILAVPEFKVPLPGGSRPSQNDIFVLARSSAGSVAIMVEGKVSESFGPTLDEWYAEPSRGKTQRLRYLLKTLGLASRPPGGVRYQLLHRAASALITAEQYRSVAGLMLVHSFSAEFAGWSDYVAFAELFGVEAERGVVQRLGESSVIPLFGVWVAGDRAYLER